MRERDYYPAGAYDDPSAPYNEVSVPERDFTICASFTLEKTMEVTTDKYNPVFDDEDGSTYADTDNTDWYDVYKENKYSILELLDELRKYVEQDLALTGENTAKGRNLKRMFEECQGWECVDNDIFEV